MQPRFAIKEDYESIMNACRNLAHENALFDMEEDLVSNMILRGLDPDDYAVTLCVIGEVGDIHGITCLYIEQYWYSQKLYILELFNYVVPEARRSYNAKKLIDFSKKISDSLNLVLMMGILTNVRLDGKVRFYERFLPKAGALFIYNADAGKSSGSVH